MRIIQLESLQAKNALDVLRLNKNPAAVIRASITLGEEQALLVKREGIIPNNSSICIFYKLRDSRYAVLGFRSQFPDFSYYPITTHRYGQSNQNVAVELHDLPEKLGPTIGFQDPMLARGTTLSSAAGKICNGRTVDEFMSFHFFAAEEGIQRLAMDLRNYANDHIMIIGRRGFRVGSDGYMGAIIHEQDYGDVMEGTYWSEYPAETERKIVSENLRKGIYFEANMGLLLFLLLRYQHVDSKWATTRPKTRPTYDWIEAVLFRLRQLGAALPIKDFSLEHMKIGWRIVSPTLYEVVRQMLGEWMIDWPKSESPLWKRTSDIRLTPWGDSYLREVLLPVLGEAGLLRPFATKLEQYLPELIGASNNDLMWQIVSHEQVRAKAPYVT